MARQFYPNENPLGQRIQMGNGSKPAEIVGIAGDVRDQELEAKGRPAVYEPAAQVPFNTMYFGIRASGDPAALIAGRARLHPRTGCRTAPRWHGHGGRTGGDVALAAPLRDAADGHLRRARADPRHGRHLRSDRVFGDPGDPGDRDPHGARRTAGRRARDGVRLCGAADCRRVSSSAAPRLWARDASSLRSSSK